MDSPHYDPAFGCEFLLYGERMVCPKCNNDLEYEEASKVKYIKAHKRSDNDVIPEHLEVSCARCGFIWWETTADQSSTGERLPEVRTKDTTQ